MTGNESVNPTALSAQVEIKPAAQPTMPEVVDAATQTVACPTTQSVRKSHHKKKIPIKCLSQPVPVPLCVDTIYDQKYIPIPPYPDISEDPNEWVIDWEAPLDKMPRSQKLNAHNTSQPNATGSTTVAKKKRSKKPKLDGEEKTSAKPHLEDPKATIPILHLHARRSRASKSKKAHATASKEAEIKVLGW